MATSSDYDNSEANNVAHEIEDFTTADRIPAAHTKPQGETHSMLPDAAVQLQHPAPIEIDEKEGRRSVEAYLAEETDKYRPVNGHHDIARLEEGERVAGASVNTKITATEPSRESPALDEGIDVQPSQTPSVAVHGAPASDPAGLISSTQGNEAASATKSGGPDTPVTEESGFNQLAGTINVQYTNDSEVINAYRDQNLPGIGYQIHAAGGNDRVYGSKQSDNLLGEGDNDTLIGGRGNDTLDGDWGFDYIDYSEDGIAEGAEGIFANLSNITRQFGTINYGVVSLKNQALDSWGNTDTLVGVEGVIGSAGNDVITAQGSSQGPFVFVGGAGGDGLFGSEGNDTIDGGIHGDHLRGYAGNDLIYSSGIVSDGAMDELWGATATIR